jgi:hypothetical protein
LRGHDASTITDFALSQFMFRIRPSAGLRLLGTVAQL